jgi:hypothetical protein
MRDSASNKFVAALAIIATPFALGAFMLAWAQAGSPKQFRLGIFTNSFCFSFVKRTQAFLSFDTDFRVTFHPFIKRSRVIKLI